MIELAMLFSAVCAIMFGCYFVRIGKSALLSQDRFLQFCQRASEGVEIEPPALECLGEPVNLKLIGLGLVEIGLFLVISAAFFLLIRLGNLT